MITCKPGATKSVKFNRLTHEREGLITADAVITCLIHDTGHTLVDTITGVADGTTGDWYADFNAPMTPGVYHILATCDAEGATLERELVFRVVSFT
jgi:hypothetical protein